MSEEELYHKEEQQQGNAEEEQNHEEEQQRGNAPPNNTINLMDESNTTVEEDDNNERNDPSDADEETNNHSGAEPPDEVIPQTTTTSGRTMPSRPAASGRQLSNVTLGTYASSSTSLSTSSFRVFHITDSDSNANNARTLPRQSHSSLDYSHTSLDYSFPVLQDANNTNFIGTRIETLSSSASSSSPSSSSSPTLFQVVSRANFFIQGNEEGMDQSLPRDWTE